MRISTLIVLLLAMAATLAPAGALAARGEEVIRDCAQDGDLDKDYSDEELEDASGNLPSDIDEYSNCRDVIRQAQAGGRGSADERGDGAAGGGGSGGSDYRGGNLSGSDVPGNGGTASDRQELDQRRDAARDGTAPAGDTAAADATGSADAGDDGGLSTGGLVAIILILLAAIAAAAYVLRDQLPDQVTSRLPGFGSGER